MHKASFLVFLKKKKGVDLVASFSFFNPPTSSHKHILVPLAGGVAGRYMMKTLNKSKKRAINCGDGRFLAVAAVLAFVCRLVGDAGFVLISLFPLSSSRRSRLWERQRFWQPD